MQKRFDMQSLHMYNSVISLPIQGDSESKNLLKRLF
jgi:hypothetical protein